MVTQDWSNIVKLHFWLYSYLYYYLVRIVNCYSINISGDGAEDLYISLWFFLQPTVRKKARYAAPDVLQ